MSSAAAASVLLLLALTGGFIFTYRWRLTYFLSRREEGQRLLFVAACAAFPLLLVSSGSLWVANRFLPARVTDPIDSVWVVLVEPYVAGTFDAATFAAFFGAFLWGWVLPWLLNFYYSVDRASNYIIEQYAGELEKLMYRAMGDFLLVSITLDSRKVYVGWPVRALIPDPRRGDIRPHIRLQPAISGYREEENQELVFTTDYEQVYQRMEEEAVPGLGENERLRKEDLQMVIPVEEIRSVNLFSTDIEQEWFEKPADQPTGNPTHKETSASGLLHTLLILLLVWGIIREPNKPD